MRAILVLLIVARVMMGPATIEPDAGRPRDTDNTYEHTEER